MGSQFSRTFSFNRHNPVIAALLHFAAAVFKRRPILPSMRHTTEDSSFKVLNSALSPASLPTEERKFVSASAPSGKEAKPDWLRHCQW
jgi:hypothetical protein